MSKRIIWFIFFLFIAQLIWVDFAFASSQGTIDPTYKYAWGENIGWINFGCSINCNVWITDSAITGYAWSENYGWINLAPSTSGVKNDGEGNLSGYAWGESLGWIDFDNVSINTSGKFTGTASGTISGIITFDCTNCDVRTDWRPRSARPACNNATDDDGDGKIDYPNDPGCDSLTDTDEADSAATPSGGGGSGGLFCNPPIPPSDGFAIFINNDAPETSSRNVNLTLRAGPDTDKMAISNFLDFREAGQEAYQKTKTWVLTEGEGTKTVYAKFYNRCGASSEVVSDSIIYKKPIIEIPEIIKKIPEIIKKIPEIIKPKPPEEIKPPEVPVEEFLPEKEKPKIAELKVKYPWIEFIDWRIIFLLLVLIIILLLYKFYRDKRK